MIYQWYIIYPENIFHICTYNILLLIWNYFNDISTTYFIKNIHFKDKTFIITDFLLKLTQKSLWYIK